MKLGVAIAAIATRVLADAARAAGQVKMLASGATKETASNN